YLGACIGSILAQDGYGDFEIIAIDDASPDNTAEVLRSFADPRLRVIMHSKNQGHVATVNEGLSEARGQFVARIDADDVYRPSFLKTLLPRFADAARVGLVYDDAAIINEHG